MGARNQNLANDQHPRLSSQRKSAVKLGPESPAAEPTTTTNPSVFGFATFNELDRRLGFREPAVARGLSVSSKSAMTQAT